MKCLNLECTQKRYYIAAVEEEWDYAPSGVDRTTGIPLPNSTDTVKHSTIPTRRRIGRKYTKALYRGFTDESFTEREEREPWQGIMGPILRGEIGDTIEVVFFNNATFPFSMHPHGVFYTPGSEGALHANATAGADVAPGARFTYTWEVPERAGPGAKDPSSLLWLYHSHRVESPDTNAGLIGPIIVYRKGELSSETGRARGTEEEFILLLTLFDEQASPYYAANRKRVLQRREEEDGPKDPEVWSDMMQSINGRVYGNLEGLSMTEGDHVRWHVSSMGNERDVHSVTWTGFTVMDHGHRVDTIPLLPASFRSVDSVPDVPGQWSVSCQVLDHYVGGMAALVNVSARAGTTRLGMEEVSPSGVPSVPSSMGGGEFGVFGWLFTLSVLAWWAVGMVRMRKLFVQP